MCFFYSWLFLFFGELFWLVNTISRSNMAWHNVIVGNEILFRLRIGSFLTAQYRPVLSKVDDRLRDWMSSRAS